MGARNPLVITVQRTSYADKPIFVERRESRGYFEARRFTAAQGKQIGSDLRIVPVTDELRAECYAAQARADLHGVRWNDVPEEQIVQVAKILGIYGSRAP